ncbi:hypothetical protein GA747_06005 [Bifidobacterium adolescentis]|nr:hypothetical protein GA747_06005 [Bifidobacterium adolescentis]
MYGRFRDATGGISLIYGSLFLKNEAFHTPYLLFRQTGLPYISEKPPDKSVNLPCISEMRAMHIEVMMFCLCRRAGHPCRKRRSKRARRPWRRDVLRRGNRLVQGFPRSVRPHVEAGQKIRTQNRPDCHLRPQVQGLRVGPARHGRGMEHPQRYAKQSDPLN